MPYTIATLEDLIAKLHKAFETDMVDVDHVMQLMKSYKTNPAEWKKFAKFDRYRYINFNFFNCVIWLDRDAQM